MRTAKEAASRIKFIVSVGLSTTMMTGLGAAALVAAHHLGRKQYNKNAKLSDYSDGVRYALATASIGKNTAKQNQPDTKLSVNWISGVADLKTHKFAVVGINIERDILWQTPMPERVHDILIQPKLATYSGDKQSSHVTVMGRRPSEYFWVLDSANGTVLHTIKANTDRHFYGHAAYSLDGTTLYVTENDTATFAGKVGVYNVTNSYQKLLEFNSHGIGPHELVMHPDGETLVIANGGIKTEKASRDELNLDTMQPSLVYINRHTSQLIEQIFPEHNQMSVRHLSMGDDGTVAIGIQFQGDRHLSVPLVLTHKRGASTFTPLNLPKGDSKGWHRFHHYIASIAVDSQSNLLCATSPIGGCAAMFELTTGKMIDSVDLPDCAGATTWGDDANNSDIPSFLVSDGQGCLTKLSVINNNNASKQLAVDKVQRPVAFDNHLKQL